jgi:hypothetical protein
MRTPLDTVRESLKPADGGNGVLDSISHAFREITQDFNKAAVHVALNAKLDSSLSHFPKAMEEMTDGKLTALVFGNLNNEAEQLKKSQAA